MRVMHCPRQLLPVKQCPARLLQTATTAVAVLPPDPTVAPAGDYMIFLLTTANIPSVATFTRLTQIAYASPAPPAGTTTTNTIASGGTLPQARRHLPACTDPGIMTA